MGYDRFWPIKNGLDLLLVHAKAFSGEDVAELFNFMSSYVTSSYVYIRLVLVTLLAEKIQCTIFYISIFPTVSKMYSKQRLLGSFFLLTNI